MEYRKAYLNCSCGDSPAVRWLFVAQWRIYGVSFPPSPHAAGFRQSKPAVFYCGRAAAAIWGTRASACGGGASPFSSRSSDAPSMRHRPPTRRAKPGVRRHHLVVVCMVTPTSSAACRGVKKGRSIIVNSPRVAAMVEGRTTFYRPAALRKRTALCFSSPRKSPPGRSTA